MKRCYEFFITQESVRESNGRISSARLFTDIHPDAEDKIEELLQKHGRNCLEFFGNCDVSFRRENIWPWSIVLFDNEFRLAGHLVSIRKSRKDLSFSAYSIKPGEYSLSKDGVPPVSILFINNKDSLQELATRSELFRMAWNQLSNCPEQQHWICIAEPPPPEWVDNICQNDDQLFMKTTSSYRSQVKSEQQDEIAEQQTELKLKTGMRDTSEEATFLDSMREHEYLEFNRRNSWDNSDQFRAFKCNNLPHQIYFDLFDKHNVLVGQRNAEIIEKITDSVPIPVTWWGGGSYKYFELDDDKLNILFSFLSESPATSAQGNVLGETKEKEGDLMQRFDPQIIETIADVLKNSKTLLGIEEWQNFELDFSTPVEEQNEIFQKIKNSIDNFNDVAGIYAIFDSDTCLYIGKGNPIWGRIKSHYKAAKGLITNERWIGFFEQYQMILRIFWIEYNELDEPTLDDKLRELFEHVLQMKYNPLFNSY